MQQPNEQNPVLLKASDSAVDILKSTKAFIQNSNKYSNYIVNYKNTKLNSPKKEGFLASCRNLYKSKSKFRRSMDFFNSSTLTINTYLNTKPNFLALSKQSEEELKNPIDIFNAQAEVFNDDNYHNKEYNYQEIYKKDDYYIQMLKKKLNDFKINPNENYTNTLCKNFTKSKYFHSINQIRLLSLEISFINPNDSASEPMTLNLPFALLPLYYFVEFETFKLLLMSILVFNENYTSIEIKFDLLTNILKTWSEYETDQDITLNNQNIQKFNWLTTKCIYDVYIK
jgi:hypothetical protein